MKKYVILLATEDQAVEAAVREAGACELHCVRTGREAVSELMDGFRNQDVAVVDLDLPEGGRALATTAGGAVPVIAISAKARPWLSSMVRHRRIRESICKPVSAETLRQAFLRVRSSAVSGVSGGC